MKRATLTLSRIDQTLWTAAKRVNAIQHPMLREMALVSFEREVLRYLVVVSMGRRGGNG